MTTTIIISTTPVVAPATMAMKDSCSTVVGGSDPGFGAGLMAAGNK